MSNSAFANSLNTYPITSALGGTGVNNGTSTITIGGNFSISGAFATALTVTGNTALTLPTTGTVVTYDGTGTFTNKTYDTGGVGNVFKIAGNTISTVTGNGSVVLANSPALVTPALGTPTSGNLSSCTGLSLTTGVTGILPAANGGTANGFTAFSGPATSTKTFALPNASDTIGCLGTAGTWTAAQTFNSSDLILKGATSGTTTLNSGATAGSSVLTLPVATDTLVGKATTDTLTNKTYDTAGTGNSFSINGVAATANTGTGAVVRAASPTIATPSIDTINLTGGQIAFPAAQNPSANANTLDDYEEGTWTAAVTLGSGTATLNASNNTGTYIKIGGLVYVTGGFNIQTVSTPSGSVKFTGLPFTNGSGIKNRVAVSVWASGLTAAAITQIVGRIQNSDTGIIMESYAAGAIANLGATLQNNCDLYITATYSVV